MLPILAFLISSSLGYLSYKIVERPIREGKRVLALPKIVVVAAGAAVVIVGALATREGLHDKARLSLSVVERAKTDWYPDTWPDSAPPAECTMRRTVEDVGEVAVSSFQRSCNGEGNGHAIRHLFVVGDSHALVYAPLLWRLASEEGIETITYSRTGCPLANLMNVQPQCQKFESTSIADILDKGAPQDIIFLPSLRLKRFVDQWGNLEKAEGKYQQEDEEDIKNRDLGYREAVALMDRLKQHRMRVIIEAPTPIYHAPAFRCSDWFNAHNPVCEGGLVISREEIRRYRAPVMEEISGLSDLYPDLIVWDPLPVLCPDETCRAITTSGQPLFFDGDHMSGLANRLLYPPFLSLLHRVWL